MSNKEKKSPELRFKGFSDAWEQRKLGDLGTVAMNRRIFKDETSDIGDVPFYKIGTFGKEPDAYISKEKFEEYKRKYPFPEIGDILISASGSIGRTMEYNGEDAYYQDSNIVWLKHNGRIDNLFLKQLYDIIKWSGVEGSTIKRLYNKTILNTRVWLPILSEQKKVGELMKLLDNTINLHQRKINILKKLKQEYLRLMFPKNTDNTPVLRFKNFYMSWEWQKWRDKVDVSTNMVNPKTGEYNHLPHIGPGNIESFTGRILENVKNVREENLISGKFFFNHGDIIYSKINPHLGKYALVDFKGLASADAYVFNAKNGLINPFLFRLLQRSDFYKYSVSVSMRTGIPKINRNELNDYKFLQPDINEQMRISNLFNKIDNILILHKYKRDKLLKIKQTYLNKLFI